MARIVPGRRRDRWSKRGFEWVAGHLVRRERVDEATLRALAPRRILVVRQHDQLGDMLCATPALRALRQRFPQARTMLVSAPVHHAAVRHHPDLDAVLLYDKRVTRRSPRAMLGFVQQLRAFRPDLAVVLNTVSFSATSAWIAALSGAPVVVGGDSVPFGATTSRWLYSRELWADPHAELHVIERGLRPLAALGIEAADRTVVLVPGKEAERQAGDFLARFAGATAIAAVHPGAGKVANRWPAERFARAVEALEAEGASVFLIEGPLDAEAVARTSTALGAPRPVLRGVDAAVVAAALARSDVALVNDTGIMHVAGAMGTPTLALFGPTPRALWEPPSPELVAVQSPDRTMDGLGLPLVLPLLRERLRRGRELRPRR